MVFGSEEKDKNKTTSQFWWDQPNPATGTWDPLNYAKDLSLQDNKRNQVSITTPAPTSGAVLGPYTNAVKGPWAGQFDYFNPNGLVWNGNAGLEEQIPIAVFGDSNGRIVGSKLSSDIVAPGSPQTQQEAANSILTSKTSTPQAIFNLKQQLFAKGILSGKAAQQSLSQGDTPDANFRNALLLAVQLGSAAQASAADQGATSFLSFDDWLASANPVPGTGDGSGTSTRVVYQKFTPEEYDIAIDQLFQQTIGRGASKEELDFFVERLQNYADLNPQTTVTKTSGDKTTVTTSGGVTGERAASMMREQALLSPNAENYNKATKYLSYFTQALNSPVELG